jgi:hypothetical protein
VSTIIRTVEDLESFDARDFTGSSREAIFSALRPHKAAWDTADIAAVLGIDQETLAYCMTGLLWHEVVPGTEATRTIKRPAMTLTPEAKALRESVGRLATAVSAGAVVRPFEPEPVVIETGKVDVDHARLFRDYIEKSQDVTVKPILQLREAPRHQAARNWNMSIATWAAALGIEPELLLEWCAMPTQELANSEHASHPSFVLWRKSLAWLANPPVDPPTGKRLQELARARARAEASESDAPSGFVPADEDPMQAKQVQWRKTRNAQAVQAAYEEANV